MRLTASFMFWINFLFSVLTLPSTKKNSTVIYIAMPSVGSLFILLFAFLKSHKVIVDYQDVWPEAFYLFLSRNHLSRSFYYGLLLLRFFLWPPRLASLFNFRVYSVSERMSNAVQYIFGKTKVHTIPISPRFPLLSFNQKCSLVDSNCLRFVYVGSCGYSYDLSTILAALGNLNELPSFNSNFVFHIFADLDDVKSFLPSIDTLYPFVRLHGLVPHEELYPFLDSAKLAFNPIKSTSYASITNKLALYCSSSLPYLTSRYSPEVTRLSESFGLPTYQALNVDSAFDSIHSIVSLSANDYQEIIGKINSYASSAFDASINYSRIVLD